MYFRVETHLLQKLTCLNGDALKGNKGVSLINEPIFPVQYYFFNVRFVGFTSIGNLKPKYKINIEIAD